MFTRIVRLIWLIVPSLLAGYVREDRGIYYPTALGGSPDDPPHIVDVP